MDIQGEEENKSAPNGTTNQKPAETASREKRDSSAEPKQAASPATDAQMNDAADDTANDDKLTSPPDTSSVSSVNPDVLGDEIVVGTRANGVKSPARRAGSAQDVAMTDADEDEEPVLHHPKRENRRDSKRKRPIENDYDHPKEATTQVNDTAYDTDASAGKGRRDRQRYGEERQREGDENKHVPIGYWRDSPVPDEKGKHIVIGFIDVRDRLRTRIRSMNINGESINTRLFPVPPGPGGSWVTFERIAFLEHLVGHDHNTIKEYVRARAETIKTRSEEADAAAIRAAQHRLAIHPPPETNQPPSIAWGWDLPDYVQASRPESKRRRHGSAAGTPTDRSERPERPERGERQDRSELPRSDRIERSEASHAEYQPQAEIQPPPRKPTRILVGVWSKSPAPDDEDKHAVFGILGANDMFRVKLVKETKDGRFMEDSFPTGAGALWISYDEVIFLDHLKDLSRPEVKEYVRIRQTQIDAGEVPSERVANETLAVHQAQIRVAQAAAGGSPGKPNSHSHANQSNITSQSGSIQEEVRETPELRHSRREVAPRGAEIPHQPRSYYPEVEIRQASQMSRAVGNDPIERVQGFANREVARMEAVQLRTDRHQANRNAVANPSFNHNMYDSHRDFHDNVQRMDHVWRAQENMRKGPVNGPVNGTSEDAMMHEGVKYERKSNGPFKDRLVSQGKIINIDGEDYVEYRVLMKPSFF